MSYVYLPFVSKLCTKFKNPLKSEGQVEDIYSIPCGTETLLKMSNSKNTKLSQIIFSVQMPFAHFHFVHNICIKLVQNSLNAEE